MMKRSFIEEGPISGGGKAASGGGGQIGRNNSAIHHSLLASFVGKDLSLRGRELAAVVCKTDVLFAR